MSGKPKTRRSSVSRTKRESTAKRVPAKASEKRAIGEIMSAFLNAITFGALEPAPAAAPAK